MNSRIALGTAQFGLSYGVANARGQVSSEEIAAILALARSQGVTTLDTAIAYGDSEQRLGQADVGRWQVITKLPPLPDACDDVTAWVDQSVAGSLRRLQLSKVHGVLLHRAHDLLGPHGDVLYRALQALKQRGAAEKIGVSIYGPEDLGLLCTRYALDLVQAPLNIMDRRLETSGWLARLSHAGVEVHARSIFLQGLLLMAPADRPAWFERWQPLWDAWHAWLRSAALSPLQACLSFALSRREVDRVVIGIDGLRQLEQILACAPRAVDVPDTLACDDSELINPSRWRLS